MSSTSQIIEKGRMPPLHIPCTPLYPACRGGYAFKYPARMLGGVRIRLEFLQDSILVLKWGGCLKLEMQDSTLVLKYKKCLPFYDFVLKQALIVEISKERKIVQ